MYFVRVRSIENLSREYVEKATIIYFRTLQVLRICQYICNNYKIIELLKVIIESSIELEAKYKSYKLWKVTM